MAWKCPKCEKTFKVAGGHANSCGSSIESLFWAKVEKTDGCWNWLASLKERGYGQFLHKGKMYRAHRLAWKLSGRELPRHPLELMHTCHNRTCVNPDHLKVGTHAENMAAMGASGRSGTAILTIEQVREIRAAVAPYKSMGKQLPYGMNQALADKYGVKPSAIYHVVSGRHWRHV